MKCTFRCYLTKPFKLEDLQLRIDSIITNRQRIRQKFQSQTDYKVEELRINELAYRVGFSTPRYFSLCFKKEYGIGVKEYAEQTQNKEETEKTE